MNLVRVSGSSNVGRVARAIAGIVRAAEPIVIEAAGVAEVNQAIKAITLARGYLQEDNIEISFVPEIGEVRTDNSAESVLRFSIVWFGKTDRFLGGRRQMLRNRYSS